MPASGYALDFIGVITLGILISDCAEIVIPFTGQVDEQFILHQGAAGAAADLIARSAAVIRVIHAELAEQSSPGGVVGLAGNDVDDASFTVAAVERALRAFEHFNAGNVKKILVLHENGGHADVVYVHGCSRVQRCNKAAHATNGRLLVGTGVLDKNVWDIPLQFHCVLDAGFFKLGFWKYSNAHRYFLYVFFAFLSGNGNRIQGIGLVAIRVCQILLRASRISQHCGTKQNCSQPPQLSQTTFSRCFAETWLFFMKTHPTSPSLTVFC